MKLTREQELILISLGIVSLLESKGKITPPPIKDVKRPKAKSKKKYRMSAEARMAVSQRMTKYWDKRRKAKKTKK